MAQAVEQALASARTSDLKQAAGPAPPESDLAQTTVFDPKVQKEPVESKKARALSLARAAFKADPRVVHVHPAEIGEAVVHLHLRNSLGVDLTHQATQVSAGAVAMAAENGKQEMAWEGDTKRFLAELEPETLGREAGKRAAAFLGAEPMPDGRYDVVLENQVAVQFLELLAASLLGDNVVKNRSLLADELGQKILSPQVTILDDGLYPRGLGTAPFDDEGTPQTKTILVDKGVVRGFVYDRLWGERAGAKSTGNAVRPSLKAPPGVGFTNLYLVPGQGTAQDLISGLDRGFFITDIMGGHTADPFSGEFSFGAAGHLVEGGRLVRPVKSMAVAGQVVEVFKAIAGLAGDLRFLGRTGSPSLLVTGLSLSGP
jgi:PmbA protein